MKSTYFVFILSFFLLSCVSTKKYKALEKSHLNKEAELLEKQNLVQVQQSRISELENAMFDLQKAVEIKDIKIDFLNRESRLLSERISGLSTELENSKMTNQDVTKKNDDLTKSNKVFAEITKNLLEELEIQHLKVLNLSIAVEQRDSLNIHLVKRAKRNMSDKKYKKALEKLGFVFH